MLYGVLYRCVKLDFGSRVKPWPMKDRRRIMYHAFAMNAHMCPAIATC